MNQQKTAKFAKENETPDSFLSFFALFATFCSKLRLVPTLFREQYLDCLRVLSRDGDPAPFLKAMQHIHDWTSRFDYQDLDGVIAKMAQCNAFERSLVQFKLLMPGQAAI